MVHECVNSTRYVGKPCKHGHDGLRYRASRNCVDCTRIAFPVNNKIAYWKNPQKHRDAASNWQKNNVAKSNERKNKWTAANRDKHSISVNKWHAANPEKRVNATRNRRARIRGSIGVHTVDDVLVILDAQHNSCFYCGTALIKYHVDHFIPVSLGGSNARFNIVCACAKCNLKKSDTAPALFTNFKTEYPHFWSERT